MAERYGYSTDGCQYTGDFATRQEAADALDGERGWTGRYIPYEWDTDELGERVVTQMIEWAYDDVGEASDAWYPTDEQVKDLDNALSECVQAWIKRNDLHPNFFRVVDAEEVNGDPIDD